MTHPKGRTPIGVEQPPSNGSHFPFLHPSEDIQQLLGDLFLSYRDDLCLFEPPFRIAWMSGFGTLDASESNSSDPSPVHAHDILILDANNNQVFDSTQADSYVEQAWGDRLLIIEWIGAQGVLRVTKYTEWSQYDLDENLDRDYNEIIEPIDGELDPRTYEARPRGVNSLTAGLSILTGKVVLEGGYNTVFSLVQTAAEAERERLLDVDLAEIAELSQKPLIAGRRRRTIVRVDMDPGGGLGQFPGCDEATPVIRKLGGATADENGNLNFDLGDCLRVARPVTLIDRDPRTFRYGAAGLSIAESKSALKMSNDCQPCCACSYFVRTYKGLKRQWTLWSELAVEAGEARDLLQQNKLRWLDERSCRMNHALRAVLLPESNCKTATGAMFCNTSGCCYVPLLARFTYEYFRAGEPFVVAPADCNITSIEGSPQFNGAEGYPLLGSWPVYDALFEYADPQDFSRVSFRLCTPACQLGDNVRVTVTIHAPDPVGDCETDEVTVPDELQTIWAGSELGAPAYPARAIVTSNLVPLNNASAYCNQCEC
jgi:hypothetical protein